MFQEISQESFDEREKRVLKFWEQGRIFERSVEEKRDRPLFSFFDGPPFATGLPHYGHYLAGTIKDVVLRYKSMKGFCVPRRFGWDCHGVPIENEIEKAFNLSGALSIQEFGVPRFNEECRSIVQRYSEEWKTLVTRMGRWVDFSATWKTMDLPFMESVWWVFKQLFDKGLIYEGYKVMPFSAKLGTPLSNFEAGENYQEVDDPSLVVTFPLLNEPETSILCWTTTPWTLVSHLAIMAGPEIEYVKVLDKKSGHRYWVAEGQLSTHFKHPEEIEIVEKKLGKELAGLRYTPPFDYFADHPTGFRVILEDQVAIGEGTGFVHSAPAFGEMDFYACQREGIELVCPVNNNGLFIAPINEYIGQFVKDADKDIAKRLKAAGRLFSQNTLRHRYPFCWRSDTPLIYKVVSSWFVGVEKIKDKMLKANAQIHWTPSHIKEGRFGKWLEGARDWAISRNRYWGTPLPIWRAEDGELMVFGSIAELEQATGTKVNDLHRHYIDDLKITKDGKEFKRIPEVLDCWFESGSMPYGQIHYPFENKEEFIKGFPADFIGEGLDQTRGWFYTLTVLSAALFDKPAFKNVVVNGIVLASDGTKMSKRLKNYPDPSIVVSKFGADSVRLYMMHSPAVKGDDLCFVESGVELVLRQIMLPLWNAYSFFITYARLYHWKPTESVATRKPDAVIDQWILSKLNGLAEEVEEGMADYDLSRAVEPFVGFVDQLTNWYIRRSRRRFWEDKDSPDRQQAFATLYQVLLELVKIAAPFIPFISDAIYQNLKGPGMPDSVHLCDFPTSNEALRDRDLEEAMAAAQTTVSLGHGLRKENKLKVRQPLGKAHVASSDARVLHFLEDQKHLIADELNVKEVVFHGDETQFVHLKAKPNFRVLGKKVGKLMKAAQTAIDKFTQAHLAAFKRGENLKLVLEGETVELTPEDIDVSREVHQGLIAANEGLITIALDTQLTEALELEGLARELVNRVNTMRREAQLYVSDRINLVIETTPRVKNAYDIHGDYIRAEVLAVDVTFGKADAEAVDLNGEPTKIVMERREGIQ
jgi:isoleucyl-tRNA synthetase